MAVDRQFYIYLKTMEKAYEDKIITSDETNLLNIIVGQFGYTHDRVLEAMDHVRGMERIQWTPEEEQVFQTSKDPDGDRDLYFKIIMQALADDDITDDEWAIINQLRVMFGFGHAEHAAIEDLVVKEIERKRGMMMNQFQDYLSNFMGKELDSQLTS